MTERATTISNETVQHGIVAWNKTDGNDQDRMRAAMEVVAADCAKQRRIDWTVAAEQLRAARGEALEDCAEIARVHARDATAYGNEEQAIAGRLIEEAIRALMSATPSPATGERDAVLEGQAIARELDDAYHFYRQRPTKDDNPSMSDMTRREATEIAEKMKRAADFIEHHIGRKG